MLKNNLINQKIVRKIATALDDLNAQVVFVGGAVVSLYINDPAADEIRPTKDVDVFLEIVSLKHLEEIRNKLNHRGFLQTPEDDVICRFRFEDIKVDIMSTKAIGWAPANPWFESGYKHVKTINIENQQVSILPLAYFLATKFAAYHNRGALDPRTSHDFEDIVYILNNQTDIVRIISNSPPEVRNYLKSEFTTMLNKPLMLEAIRGNLFYEMQEERLAIIKNRLSKMIT